MSKYTNIIIIIIAATYAISSLSILLTESFVLFISFSLVFMAIVGNSKFKIRVSKEDFRYEETLRFLILMKNWNRALIRLTDVKIYHFLTLSMALATHQVMWVQKMLPSYKQYESIVLRKTALKRMNVINGWTRTQIFKKHEE